MAVRVDNTLDKRFGAAKDIGSVYDKNTKLAGNFDIWTMNADGRQPRALVPTASGAVEREPAS